MVIKGTFNYKSLFIFLCYFALEFMTEVFSKASKVFLELYFILKGNPQRWFSGSEHASDKSASYCYFGKRNCWSCWK